MQVSNCVFIAITLYWPNVILFGCIAIYGAVKYDDVTTLTKWSYICGVQSS